VVLLNCFCGAEHLFTDEEVVFQMESSVIRCLVLLFGSIGRSQEMFVLGPGSVRKEMSIELKTF